MENKHWYSKPKLSFFILAAISVILFFSFSKIELGESNDSRYTINDWFIESTNSKHTRLYSNDRPLYSGERGHIHDVPPHRYWVHITLRGFDEYITDKIDIYDDVIYFTIVSRAE